MTLESARLTLRQYTEKDLPFLASMLSDPDMVRYIGNGQTRDQEGARRFFNRILESYTSGQDLGLRVIIRKEDNMTIGHAGLVPQRIDHQKEIEIGYWIARDYWGHGFATEIASALKKHALEDLQISDAFP